MTTLTEAQAADHARIVAELLAPERIRRSALSCIVTGTTPQLLRGAAVTACPDLEPVWLAWADEIEALAAHGVSGETARDAAKIALAVGSTAAAFRHPEAYQDEPAMRRRVGLVADEMDALLAEGFDPAAYMREIEREIDQALGGAR